MFFFFLLGISREVGSVDFVIIYVYNGKCWLLY